MRGWRWLGFGLLLLGMILGILGNHALGDRVPVSEPGTVNPQRLWADVEALSVPRHTKGDRQAALLYLEQSLGDAGWQTQRQPFEGGVNLVAQLGSEQPGDRLILGAHYDTVAPSPGADDNATGLAVLLEIARQVAAMPVRPARSLTLAIFDQEESGLRGSRAFAADNTLGQGVVGAIILDMVGYACTTPGCQTYPPQLDLPNPRDRGDFLAVIGDLPHAQLVDAFEPESDRHPPLIPLVVPAEITLLPDAARSDHAAFWEQGIGAVLVTDTANFRNPHYHQDSDRPDTLDPDFFQAAAQRIWATVFTLLQS
jgi:Zn-dependent M28 family amino/carboxypeptidase